VRRQGGLRKQEERIRLLCVKVLGKSQEQARALTTGYLHFIQLKLSSIDSLGVGRVVAPSAAVDEVWHTHILDTRSYRDFEALVLGCRTFGGVPPGSKRKRDDHDDDASSDEESEDEQLEQSHLHIDHSPLLEEQPEYSERLANTLNLYTSTFGQLPPPELWWEGSQDVKLITLTVDVCRSKADAGMGGGGGGSRGT
jgi:hypothetical protein